MIVMITASTPSLKASSRPVSDSAWVSAGLPEWLSGPLASGNITHSLPHTPAGVTRVDPRRHSFGSGPDSVEALAPGEGDVPLARHPWPWFPGEASLVVNPWGGILGRGAPAGRPLADPPDRFRRQGAGRQCKMNRNHAQTARRKASTCRCLVSRRLTTWRM